MLTVELAAQNEILRDALTNACELPRMLPALNGLLGLAVLEHCSAVLEEPNLGIEALRKHDLDIAVKVLDLVELHRCRNDILEAIFNEEE